MIKKMVGIICDECGSAINYYPYYYPYFTVKGALEEARKRGAIVKNGKHFCNNNCEDKFESRKK